MKRRKLYVKHEVRRILSRNVHSHWRELEGIVKDWKDRGEDGDISITQENVDEFKEIALKIYKLSLDHEADFIRYEKARQDYSDEQKMKSHKFNNESIARLSKIYNELYEAKYELENYPEIDIENVDKYIDISSLTDHMNEFLDVIKK